MALVTQHDKYDSQDIFNEVFDDVAKTLNVTVNGNLTAAATGGYSYSSINSIATTLVKTGAGTLHSLTIAGGTAGAITVYDNTSALAPTIIAAFTPTSVGTPITLLLDVAFATGLTIVTAAATVITVAFK